MDASPVSMATACSQGNSAAPGPAASSGLKLDVEDPMPISPFDLVMTIIFVAAIPLIIRAAL
jgi:hypothetical protein